SNGTQTQLLFIRDGTVVTQTLDTQNIVLVGEPVPVAEHVGTLFAGVGGASYAFLTASSGVLIYRVGPNGSDDTAQLTWFSRDGKLLSAVGDPASYQNVLLARDQTHAAIVRGNDLWVMDLIRGTSTRLTTHGGLSQSSGVWSPDGTHIAYTANING